MKLKIWIGIFALAILFTGTACGKQKALENKSQTKQERNDREQSEMPKQEPEPTLEDVYGLILTKSSPEFTKNHGIDEVFLDWILENFGEETLWKLAEELERNQQDSRLWERLTGNSVHVLFDMYMRDLGNWDASLERVCWKECAEQDKIVLDFVGDVAFSEDKATTQYMDQQANGIYDCLSSALLEELNSADITMLNNEFVYSTRGTPVEGKAYTYRAKPKRVKLLDIMGADIVSLANNHAYDFGPEALVDTCDTLDEAGIPYVGAGRNLAEAMKPAYFIMNGKKIAIVSATQVERSTNYTKQATEDRAGVLKTLNPEKFVTVIEEAENNADYVIVYVHWGTEYAEYFDSDQKQLADAYIEAGADAIIGGHTHCLQGFQYRSGVPIIYSLSNFWFNNKTQDTGIAQLILYKDGKVDFRFIPCIQKGCRTRLSGDEEEKQRILDYMKSISSGVHIDKEGYITDKTN